MLGIGLLICVGAEPEEGIPAKLNRHRATHLLSSLRPEHKTWALAGNDDSDRYSPFKDTCRQILRLVKKNPGCDLKFLVENVRHHYSSSASFKSAIPKWIMLGKVPGLRVEKLGRKNIFYEK